MRSIFLFVLFSALVGLGVGAALALVEVRPWVSYRVVQQSASGGASAAEKSGQPRAEVSETVFQFGSIERGTSMSHFFEVRNVGDAPLSVKVGKPTCKCTVGKVSAEVVQPGDVAQIELVWHAEAAPGPFRHGAPLLTNDPQQPRIELSVEGIVVESTMLSPAELLFGSMKAGQTREVSLYLMTFEDPAVEVLSYEVEGNQNVQVRVEPVEIDELPLKEATSGVKITGSYQAGKRLGSISGWIHLKTNLPKAPSLRIPLLGNVAGDIAIYGFGWNAKSSLLRLGNVVGAEGKEVRLKVSLRGEHALATKLEVASVDPPELKVTLGERRELGKELVHVPLLVEIPVGTRPMVRAGGASSEEAEIVLRTTHPLSPEVTMRVQLTVQ